MQTFKSLVLCLFAFSTGMASAEPTNFFLRANRLGCGTITSVRDVNQAPLYDKQYELLVSGKGSSSTLMGAAVQLDLVGAGQALVLGVTLDATRGSSTSQEGVRPVEPSEGFAWKGVKAVRIRMDDGHVLNLPLTAQPTLSLGPKYDEGQRVTLFLIPQHKSIQVALAGMKPMPGHKNYAGWCSGFVDPSDSAAALAAAASLVREDKIVTSE